MWVARRRRRGARLTRGCHARSLLLGLFYSADVPLLRWKRSPFLAAACIFGVRALAVQFGFYFHMMNVLQRCAPPCRRAHAHQAARCLPGRRGIRRALGMPPAYAAQCVRRWRA